MGEVHPEKDIAPTMHGLIVADHNHRPVLPSIDNQYDQTLARLIDFACAGSANLGPPTVEEARLMLDSYFWYVDGLCIPPPPPHDLPKLAESSIHDSLPAHPRE